MSHITNKQMLYRTLYVAVLLALITFLAPAPAFAHVGHTGPVETVIQSVGPYELAVTVEIPPAVPGPLYLNLAPQQSFGDATITVRAAPSGQSFDNASTAKVQTVAGPQGTYYTQVSVDRAGDWELQVQVDGPKGRGVAQIPVTITIAPLPPYTIPLVLSLGGLFVLMLLSIILAAIFKHRQQPVPGWANWIVGHAMFACLIVAAIFGAQQINASIQEAQAASSTTQVTGGRPHVNMAIQTLPSTLAAGKPMTLTLDLIDGSTGLPADDIVPHHEALIHLVVIDDTGAFFNHVHPARISPGRYTIALTPDRPGRYTAYAELARQDSGVQVVSRSFVVPGTPVAAPAVQGLGQRTIGDLQVNVSSSETPFRAGKQATLTFSVSANGAPVNDIQPWLGMAGHLIIRNNDGDLAHIHALGAMAPSGVAESGIRYGPDIRFVYTFPQAGRYELWGQFQRAGQIVTVPVVVEVEP